MPKQYKLKPINYVRIKRACKKLDKDYKNVLSGIKTLGNNTLLFQDFCECPQDIITVIIARRF